MQRVWFMYIVVFPLNFLTLNFLSNDLYCLPYPNLCHSRNLTTIDFIIEVHQTLRTYLISG